MLIRFLLLRALRVPCLRAASEDGDAEGDENRRGHHRERQSVVIQKIGRLRGQVSILAQQIEGRRPRVKQNSTVHAAELVQAKFQRGDDSEVSAATADRPKQFFVLCWADRDVIAVGIHETRWPARLERIQKAGVQWILDVAHNPAGAWALRAGLSRILADQSKPTILIFSCLRDKPVAEMAQILFPLFDQVIIAPIHTARATALQDLLAAAQATGTLAESAASVSDAMLA